MWIFDSLDEVMDIFHLFPNLKAVNTNEIAWRQHLLTAAQGATSHKPFPSELQLESIVLRATGLTWQFVEFYQLKFNIHSLASLSIWQLHTDDIEILGRFLRVIGPHLRRLQLKLSDVRFVDEPGYLTPEDTWPLLNLQECIALQSFILFVPMDDDPSLPGPAIDYIPYWESVEILLEDLPPNVTDLRFGLEVLCKHFLKELLEEVRWTVIEGVLARLPELKSLSFLREDRHEEHVVAELPSAVQRLIKRMLPSAAQRQLLCFSVPRRRIETY
ncbi:hypothetical protein NM688_g9314 [Phlebia brevispora]|uniref:Uncharacterized protein n=1 Tax=Phlebia brevispora TaxID=194682 RepID=A0ACC1RIB0_9APHY|nr:hypothetical protein NM688_g9314 [Phlebia brevispora]